MTKRSTLVLFLLLGCDQPESTSDCEMIAAGADACWQESVLSDCELNCTHTKTACEGFGGGEACGMAEGVCRENCAKGYGQLANDSVWWLGAINECAQPPEARANMCNAEGY